MQVQILYGSEIQSKEQLHVLLAQRLSFPSHYGNNLDALYDCLCERSKAVQLIIAEKEALSENLADYGKQFLQVLTDAAAENPLLTIQYR